MCVRVSAHPVEVQDIGSELPIEQLRDLHAATSGPGPPPVVAPCRDLAAELAYLTLGTPPHKPSGEHNDSLQRARAVRPPSSASTGSCKQQAPSGSRAVVRLPQKSVDSISQRLAHIETDDSNSSNLDASDLNTSHAAGGQETIAPDAGPLEVVGADGTTHPRMLTRCLMCGEDVGCSMCRADASVCDGDVGTLQDDLQRLAHLHLCMATSAWHLLQVRCTLVVVFSQFFVFFFTRVHTLCVFTNLQAMTEIVKLLKLSNSNRQHWMQTRHTLPRCLRCCS